MHCKSYLSPLSKATYEDKVEILTLLIENGADVNMVDGKNWNPGKKDIVKQLLQTGACPNLYHKGYYSPLNRPINDDKKELITFLIENGADVSMVGGVKWTPLTKVVNKDNMNIIMTLLQNGANLNLNAEAILYL